MGDVKSKRLFVQKYAECHTVAGEASTRLGQSSIGYFGERQARPWIFLHGCQQEQRHHPGRGYTDGAFGESQEVHPWNKNDICWHYEECRKGRPVAYIRKATSE